MKNKLVIAVLFLLALGAFFACSKSSQNSPESGPANTANPPATVKLMFIHHSTGSNWVEDGYGNQGAGLNAANFYVTVKWTPLSRQLGVEFKMVTDQAAAA